jgi:Raf kinase inhibitor-like YbhB/YbcL family protein
VAPTLNAAWAQDASRRLVLESPTLKAGQTVPPQYTADGVNQSPPLSWRNVPPGTVHLVVSLQDDDEVVPMQSPFLHWTVYNIPAAARQLPAGLPNVEVITAPPELLGACQAYTAFSYPSYRGPQPAPGQLHHYRFIIRAIDTDLGLERGLFSNAVLRALDGHVIAMAELPVVYTRERRD